MITRFRAIVAALAISAGILAPTLAASAATAAPPPGATLVQANVYGWSGMSYRPGTIHIGLGAAPFVYNLSWGSWGTWAATTSGGRIRQYWPNGGPSYTWPSTTRPVTVYLHDRLTHNGHPYFAKMRWNWVSASGNAKVAYWLFTGSWGSRG
jgi:hypothetical protein